MTSSLIPIMTQTKSVHLLTCHFIHEPFQHFIPVHAYISQDASPFMVSDETWHYTTLPNQLIDRMTKYPVRC
jgi:hypothetical protein